ncbi:MAG: hypothetical protein IT530_07595 [Burkholderiales bacterium]|nr:hypothetical protein [Burkholderiales bacterium]
MSLIREQTAAIKPPRALWVPFMLGRPFGAPTDARFQRRVLLAVLRLFEAPSGPVLEDFAQDAPADPGDAIGYACPVSFEPQALGTDDLGAELLREIGQLAAWHELARRRRGRSTVGISGLPIEDAARLVAAMIAHRTLARPHTDAALGTVLKRCCDDIKAYYFEALGAQPGQLSASAIDHTFWHRTTAGRAFIRLRAAALTHPDKSVVAFVERSLVPRALLHERASAP